MLAKPLGELLANVPDTPSFIAWPVLPLGGKFCLYGPKKHFKSMLLYNMLYDLAEGVPLLGKWPIERPYRSLIIEQEIGTFMTRKRFEEIHRYRGGEKAAKNIDIISKHRQMQLDTKAGIDIFKQELGEPGRYDLLVLDPIRKFHHVDENDNSRVLSNVINPMDFLIAEFGVTVIFTHHQGHGDGERYSPHPRGASVFGDDVDTLVRLSRPTSDKTVLRFTVTDIRHAEEPAPFDIKFDKTSHTFSLCGEKQ